MRVRGIAAAVLVCAVAGCTAVPPAAQTSVNAPDPSTSSAPHHSHSPDPATSGPSGSPTTAPSSSPSGSPSSSPTYPAVAPPSNPSRVDGHPVVYLTFDDGPASGPEGTAAVLDALARHHAVGTFMVVGYLANRYPDVLRAIVAQGSTIGNHTYSHKNLTAITDKSLHWQLNATQEAVRTATGKTPTCLRPPYGAVNDRVRYLASTQGLTTQMWNNDWTNGSTTYEKQASASQAAQRVLATLHPGSVVLMHDGEEWGQKTAEITDQVLAAIEAKGWVTAPLCTMH